MINAFDQEYNNLCKAVLDNGTMIMNERTGKRCLTHHGHMMKFDLSQADFPLLTTKKVLFDPIVGELIGFIRGCDNAAGFRKLGSNIWDANANDNEQWLANPNRKGTDDLGRIYGVQARDWNGEVDQLAQVIEKISAGIDDRRLIVNHWNPSDFDKMALPPCHVMYNFGIVNGRLNMAMYQRSADIPLGVPFNIASYALLLLIVAKKCNLLAGEFTHFIFNAHIYEDQIDKLVNVQLKRESFPPPKIHVSDGIKSINMESIEPFMIQLVEYKHHPFIKYPFSV